MNFIQTPLVIGGTAGVGTIIVSHLCRRIGMYMGANLNKHLDAPHFERFYDTWVPVMLSSKSTVLTEAQNKKMYGDFLGCIRNHRKGIQNQAAPWGWKNSRSMYLVPFFHALYPQMRFIHVVCDGRDIAFLKDPKQLLHQTRSFFDTSFDSLVLPYRLMLLWKATNLTIASYGESRMKNMYLRLRYEDLCENPAGMIRRLLRFLHVSKVDVTKLATEVRHPSTFGRWHIFPVDLVEQVTELGKDALGAFGYL